MATTTLTDEQWSGLVHLMRAISRAEAARGRDSDQAYYLDDVADRVAEDVRPLFVPEE